jgi:hypothetical protein
MQNDLDEINRIWKQKHQQVKKEKREQKLNEFEKLLNHVEEKMKCFRLKHQF